MAAENARLSQAREWLHEQKLDGLIAFNDGQNSFLDGNAVYVFSGVRPIGRSAVVLPREGASILIVEPASDLDRVMRVLDVRKELHGHDREHHSCGEVLNAAAHLLAWCTHCGDRGSDRHRRDRDERKDENLAERSELTHPEFRHSVRLIDPIVYSGT